MKVVDSKASLREVLVAWRTEESGASVPSVGFVPTMGALHEGHMQLVRSARDNNEKTVVSIFVNPAQFDRAADLDSYPSDLEADLELLRRANVDLVFVGKSEDIYAKDHNCWVVPTGDLVANMCGRTRGIHFRGVATIVLKLFNLIQPSRAYFGEKDFQQLAIIRRLASDLDLTVEVVGGATVREVDGLAMSSRNRRLSAEQRQAAVAISRSLRLAKQEFLSGERQREKLSQSICSHIEAAGGRIDYVDIVDSESLALVDFCESHNRIAIAAFFGDVRLIDNCQLDSPPQVAVN